MPHILKQSLGLATDSSLLLLSLILLLLPSLLVGVQQLPVEIVKHLVLVILWSLVDLSGKGRSQCLELLRAEFASLWHGYFELDDKVASRGWLIEEGHTVLFHHPFAFVSNYIPWSGVNGQLLTIKKSDLKIEAKKGLNQRDCLLNEKIGSFASEGIMMNFFDVQHQVSSFEAVDFVALFLDSDHVACWSSRRNWYL